VTCFLPESNRGPYGLLISWVPRSPPLSYGDGWITENPLGPSFNRLDGDRRLLRCLPNTRTFVPNDRSQCLYCVLPIMRCACGAHLDVGLAERRTPCRNLMFPSLFLWEHGHVPGSNRKNWKNVFWTKIALAHWIEPVRSARKGVLRVFWGCQTNHFGV